VSIPTVSRRVTRALAELRKIMRSEGPEP
jgi:hypothetical protein